MPVELPNEVIGTVIEPATGVPLAGVEVRWVVTTDKDRADWTEVARGVSGGDGTFILTRPELPEIAALLCETRYRDTVTSQVRAVDATGEPVAEPVTLSRETREVVLEVRGGREASVDDWTMTASFLASNRLYLARDLAEQLANPFGDSPVRAWGAATRAAALRRMQGALGGLPDAIAPPADLLEQHHFLDFDALDQGTFNTAVTHYATASGVAELAERGFALVPRFRQTDLELYRDYLRAVWVAAARGMHGGDAAKEQTVPPALLERQLDWRFQQDFHTPDNRRVPAVRLLIPLATAILTSGPERGGFGLPPASVPAQGAQSDDEYLATLTSLADGGAHEMRNRFRVRFDRAPGELTSPVDLNVEALQGLLADTYQSPEEPFPAQPPVSMEKPLIFGEFVGRAPFFLQYEEWLERQAPLYPENVFDIRRVIPWFGQVYRDAANLYAATAFNPWPGQDYFDRPNETARTGAWLQSHIAIVDKLREGVAQLDEERYREAIGTFEQVSSMAWKAADSKQYPGEWVLDDFWWWNGTSWNDDPKVSLKARAALKVTNTGELRRLEAFYDTPGYPEWTGIPDNLHLARGKAIARARTMYFHHLIYVAHVLVPYLEARAYAGLGDLRAAIDLLSFLSGYRVGVAEPGQPLPYAQWGPQDWWRPAQLHREQTLPYTTQVGFDDRHRYADQAPAFVPPPVNLTDLGLPRSGGRRHIAPFEQRFFKLQQGELMLAWADELYRNDDPSSIRRARELYKGVLFMHGEDPEIAPDFPGDGDRLLLLPPGLGGGGVFTLGRATNPAKLSQTTRARLGLFQIDAGLNAYGFRDDLVPVLRYRPLKQAADAFAVSAKSAQTDYLEYMTRFEQAQIERWQAQTLVTKAGAASAIADERIGIAQYGVDRAKEQVAAVLAQIKQKEQEAADADSFFGQAKAFFEGTKDALTGMVPLAGKVIAGEGGAAGAVTGDQMLSIFSKGFSGGGAGAKEAAAGALGAGGAFVAGMGIWAYVSYQSMEAMADASSKRAGDLKSLREGALPAAEAQVRLKERDVRIANYERQIAQADLAYARQLLRFQQERFLNTEFWQRMTRLANRLMQRYVELAARTAWFAERALAFEQARPLKVIRLNYLPPRLRGVTGADRILADLAELEAQRLQGIRLLTPVKHTVSLAREFPVAFGALKRTGRCRFRTSERSLREAYPGTFSHRIRAVTVAAQDADGPPPRGILRNGGVSQVSREDPSQRDTLVRFPDALALSDFRLQSDLFVYGLPGETLLQFEGGGFDTDWELEFFAGANPRGLRSLVDVLLTFDLNASYSTQAAAFLAVPPAGPVSRGLMLAASVWDSTGLASFRRVNVPARVTFDLSRLTLPHNETNRTVRNLAVLCLGTTREDYSATINAPRIPAQAAFTIENGIALSNAGPLLGTQPAAPLNALTGLALEQPFVLTLSRAGRARAEIERLLDVVLWVEYEATLA